MKILGIDFSSSRRSVALVDCGGPRPAVLAERVETGTRETHAFRMIGSVLDSAGIARESVDALALGLGPGSYGGIRVALALAQGWQIATGIRTAGVDSSEAIARQAWSRGLRGPIQVVIDAQRREFYQARFTLDDAGLQPTAPLRIVNLEVLKESVDEGLQVVGPDLEERLPQATAMHPDAGSVGILAGSKNVFVTADTLAPIYLRPTAFVKALRPRTDL